MGGNLGKLWSSRMAGPQGTLGLYGHFDRKHRNNLWQATNTNIQDTE